MRASSLHDTGHDLTLHRSAPFSAATMLLWSALVLGQDGRAPGCAGLRAVEHVVPPAALPCA